MAKDGFDRTVGNRFNFKFTEIERFTKTILPTLRSEVKIGFFVNIFRKSTFTCYGKVTSYAYKYNKEIKHLYRHFHRSFVKLW